MYSFRRELIALATARSSFSLGCQDPLRGNLASTRKATRPVSTGKNLAHAFSESVALKAAANPIH
jgi:hypothetical protein